MTTTGPYTKTIYTVPYSLYRKWYRSKPPFIGDVRPPLAYQFTTVNRDPRSTSGYPASNNTALWANLYGAVDLNGYLTAGYYKAYCKLRDAINDQAQWLVNIAERKQAVDMIEKSANRFLFALQLLSKGRKHAAASALGIILPRNATRYSRPKDAGNIWLEWHFGWSPLLEDIHTGLKILDSDWTTKRCVGRSTCSTNKTVKSSQGVWSQNMTLNARIRMGATVRVTDPAIHTLAQFGVLNPAAVAWELIPFSFLVDWFIPVGDYLNSFTDFLGLELTNTYTTTYVVGSDAQDYRQDPWPPERGACTGASMTRVPSIVYPMLHLRPFKGLSVSRGATAIALLMQFLPRVR